MKLHSSSPSSKRVPERASGRSLFVEEAVQITASHNSGDGAGKDRRLEVWQMMPY